MEMRGLHSQFLFVVIVWHKLVLPWLNLDGLENTFTQAQKHDARLNSSFFNEMYTYTELQIVTAPILGFWEMTAFMYQSSYSTIKLHFEQRYQATKY